MGTRLELQQVLVDVLGTNNVYFQPPSSANMVYPCIVYNRDNIETKFSGNLPYYLKNRYSVIYIDRDPDSPIPDLIAKLPLCSFSRFYVVNNLNHSAFSLFF